MTDDQESDYRAFESALEDLVNLLAGQRELTKEEELAQNEVVQYVRRALRMPAS